MDFSRCYPRLELVGNVFVYYLLKMGKIHETLSYQYGFEKYVTPFLV